MDARECFKRREARELAPYIMDRISFEPNMLGLKEFAAAITGLGEYRGDARWAHQDSNLGPSDYESDALTN